MNFDGPVPGVPDATIRMVADLPDLTRDGKQISMYFWERDGQMMVAMPGVARYLIRDGKSIEIKVEPGADPGAVSLYLNGAARAALIHQRGEIPFHAATLVVPGSERAVAICGASGNGKSTLAAELTRRGWALVSDDMTRITSEASTAIAWPGQKRIKLWRDACERLGLDVSTLQQVRGGMEKYIVDTPICAEPVRLDAIVELIAAETPAWKELSKVAAIELIGRHIFRPKPIKALGKLGEHMQAVVKLTGAVRAFQLHGARSASPAVLADAVEAALK